MGLTVRVVPSKTSRVTFHVLRAVCHAAQGIAASCLTNGGANEQKPIAVNNDDLVFLAGRIGSSGSSRIPTQSATSASEFIACNSDVVGSILHEVQAKLANLFRVCMPNLP